jgi:hypothetical protein
MTAADRYGRLLGYCGRRRWAIGMVAGEVPAGPAGRYHPTRSAIFFGSTIAAQAAWSSASVVSVEDQSSGSRHGIQKSGLSACGIGNKFLPK